jgi:hypothetical protein
MDSKKVRTWDEVVAETRDRVLNDFRRVCPEGRLPLGNGKVIDQSRQTVWGTKDGEVWFRPAR